MKKTKLFTKGFLKRFLTRAIIIAFIASLAICNINPVAADDLTDQINSKKQQLNDVNQQISTLQSQVNQKDNEVSTLNSQLDAIDSQIQLSQLQIQSTQLEIDQTNDQITQNQNDIAEKETEIAAQKVSINNVIKELYENKDDNVLTVILSSTDFSSMIDQAEYLTKIQSSLKDGLDKLQVLKQELETQNDQLNTQKTQLEDLKQQNENAEKSLEDQKNSKVQIIEITRGEEANYQSALAQENAAEQSASAEITALVQEEVRRQQSANNVQARDGRTQPTMTGQFICPLTAGCRISVTGGDFMDPQYGFSFPHTGVDLTAAQGTPVMAAGTGSVVIAYDSGGPGLSYVAIDHGNGLVSKYLHLSAIYVKTGDVVNAGDVIGLSGGTPGSHGAGPFTTGAHLHFEIDDYNGNPINPHNYLNILPPLY